MRIAVAAIAVAALALSATADAPAAAQAEQDTVRVIHLVIDGLDPSQVGPDTPVLADLKDRGIWWEQARAVMAAETLPNHVAMATGAYPERTGIPGNDGRAEPGDDGPAEPDLGRPDLLEARSFTTAIETACPDLRTVTVFSKAYVHRIFAEDGADADFPQPLFNIPESDHAFDTATVSYINQQLATEDPPDYLFANLGDVDRAGHIDATGFTGAPAEQRLAIQQTDALVGTIVENLRQQGLWDDTVLVINSDHTMDWSRPDGSEAAVDVAGALDADERTTGRFFVATNGGAGLVYLLDPEADDRHEVLAAGRDVVSQMDGVAEALYRDPNPLDPGHDLASVHPDWHAGTHRIGELFVHVEAGHKVGSPTSNPLPGNHGHGITRHITMLVTGGWDGLAEPVSIAPSDPDAVNVVDDTAALPEQAEQVDLAPTYGWLLGVADPGPDQWQGRVLAEAFDRQPQALCVEPAAQPAPTSPAAEPPAADGAPDPERAATPVTGGGAALVAVVALTGAWVLRRRGRAARGSRPPGG